MAFNDIVERVRKFVKSSPGDFRGIDPRNIVAHLGKVNRPLWNELDSAYREEVQKKGSEIERSLTGTQGPPTLNEWAFTSDIGNNLASLVGAEPLKHEDESDEEFNRLLSAFVEKTGGGALASPEERTRIKNDYLKALRTDGKLSEKAFGGNQYLLNEFKNLKQSYSRSRDPYKYYKTQADTFAGKDPGELSDEELNQYAAALEGLGKSPQREVSGETYLIGPDGLEDRKTNYKEIGPAPDTSGQVKQLRGILDSRLLQSQNRKQIQDFLNDVPAQLEAERNRKFAGESSRAVDYVTGTYAPMVREQLAARGLDESGELPATIAQKFGEVQSTLESEQMNQEAEDLQFYADLAYKVTYQGLIDTSMNVSGQIQNQYANTLQSQANSFRQKQATIDNKLNLKLFQDQNEAAVKAAQDNAAYARDKVRKNSQSNAAFNIGLGVASTVGNVATGNAPGAGASAAQTFSQIG